MSPSALVLIHDSDVTRGERMTGLLSDALRTAGLRPEIRSLVAGQSLPDPADVTAVLPLGSEAAAYDDSLPWLDAELAYLRAAIAADVPVLGICFGAQVLARALGGSVEKGTVPELGFIHVDTAEPGLLPAGPWLSSHYDVINPPASARVIAQTELAVQAFVQGPHLGIQFHPEADRGVLLAWQERIRSTLAPGADETLPGWLDVDAVVAELDATYEVRRQLCQNVLDHFLAGRFAAAAARSSAER